MSMKVYDYIIDMKVARDQLGSPAGLNECIVATGIDALFALLDGDVVEFEGVKYRLVAVAEGETP